MREKFNETFTEFWNYTIEMTPSFLVAILVFAFFVFIGRMLYNLLKNRLSKKWNETIVTQFAANALKWIFYLIGIMAALDILNLGGIASSIMAGAGISAIILGFAFKDIGENFLAGFLLAVNRPFTIGNIIEVNGFKGTVKGMDMRTIHIRNIDGRDIFIPNSMIIKDVVVNYTKDGLLRQGFEIGLDVPTKVEEAKQLILDYLKTQPDVLQTPHPDVLTSEIGEFTVNVNVLFWVDVFKNKNASPSLLGITIKSRIINDVKDLLLKNGFNLPSQVLEHKNYSDAIIVKN